MKKIGSILIGALILSMAATAGGREKTGGGTRGGGGFTKKGKKLVMTGQIRKGLCHWMDGQELAQKTPELKTLISKISELDWYYALTLELEIERLVYCKTKGKLIRILDSNVQSEFVETEELEPLQAGIREDIRPDSIPDTYVDWNLFSRANGETRAIFLAHEATHSFIPMDVSERQLKMESMDYTYFSILRGKIATQKSLRLQMQQNDVEIPELDLQDRDLTFLLRLALSHPSSWEDRTYGLSAEQLKRAQERLRDFSSHSLWTHHQDRFNGARDSLMNFLDQKICANASSLAIPTPEEFATWAASPESSRYLNSTLKELAQKDLEIRRNRIAANASLELFGLPKTPASWYSEVKSCTYWSRTSAMLRRLSGYTIAAIRDQNWQWIETYLGHPSFEAAMKADSLLRSLSAMEAPIPREKEIALMAIQEAHKAYWKELLESAHDEISPEATASYESLEKFETRLEALDLI